MDSPAGVPTYPQADYYDEATGPICTLDGTHTNEMTSLPRECTPLCAIEGLDLQWNRNRRLPKGSSNNREAADGGPVVEMVQLSDRVAGLSILKRSCDPRNHVQ